MDIYKPFSYFSYNDYFNFKGVYLPPPRRINKNPPGFSYRRNVVLSIKTDLNTNAPPFSPVSPISPVTPDSDEPFFKFGNITECELEKSPRKNRKFFKRK